ncbi:MAG: zinc metallopeptidase, partial [Gaiellaceae bacterium]
MTTGCGTGVLFSSSNATRVRVRLSREVARGAREPVRRLTRAPEIDVKTPRGPAGSHPPMFFYDPTYLFMLPALAFALWAQWKVQSTYRRYSNVRSSAGMRGRDMARAIMVRNGVTDVAVEEVPGMLSDHYDPRDKTVRLSSANYNGESIAAIAVSAHEVGHVLQHAQGYAPLGIRTAIAPVAGFGSTLAFPLFLIGFFFRSGASHLLMDLGIWFFSAAVLFQVVTLPVEFNASKRALVQLNE